VPQRPLEPLIRNLEMESQLGDDEREAVRQLPFTVSCGRRYRSGEGKPFAVLRGAGGVVMPSRNHAGRRSADILFPYRGGCPRFAEPCT
jgi:hypothetical protein